MTRKRTHARKRRVRIANLRRLLFFVVFLAIAAVSLFKLVNYKVESVRRVRTNEQLARAYSEAFIPAPTENPEAMSEYAAAAQATVVPTVTPAPSILSKYRNLTGVVPQTAHKLYKLNNDLVGWLYIRGMVDLPVVFRDNEYYLTHAFNEEEDSGGALFLDENHPMTEGTQNLVIHGHNMYDGSMFGELKDYQKLATVKGKAFARFSTLYAPEDYVIFAVLRVNPDPESENYFPYIGRASFANEAQFYDYVNEIRERSLFDIPVEVLPSDALLTLATCQADDRLVVVYRRLRDGETQAELQAQVDYATQK